MDGVVLSGDLRHRLGEQIQTGKPLFEVAPSGEHYVELRVPEPRIADVKVGQRGELAAAAHPGDFLPIQIVHVNPMAEVFDGHNVFRVRAKLLEGRAWLRPGTEGVARLDAGRESIGKLWTRDLVNWVRMKLWF